MFVLCLLQCCVTGQYLYPEYENLIRIPNSVPFGMIQIQDSILFGVSTSDSIQLYLASTNFSQCSIKLEIKGQNVYKPLKLWQNSTFLFVLTNVVLNNFFELINLNSPGYPKLGMRQGVIFLIDLKDLKIVESRFVCQCFSGNSVVFDGFSVGNRVLVLGTNDCLNNETVLGVVGQSDFRLGIYCQSGQGFVLNSYLYILCQTQDIKLLKFDLFLSLQWSTIIYSSTLLSYSLSDTYFFILTQNSILKINENSSVLFSQYFNSYSFNTFLNSNLGIFLLGYNNFSPSTSSIIWLNTDLKVNTQRSYLNISHIYSFKPYTSTTYLMMFSSNQSFYSDFYLNSSLSSVLVKIQQPFANANCHPSCSSCYGPSNATCFSCKYFEYKKNSQTICGTCHPACADCFDSSQSSCLSCSVGYILYNTKCYKDLKCPSGQYQRILQEQCQNCDKACLTCTGSSSNDCLSCAPNYISDGKSCVKSCPSGKYAENNYCQVCSSECEMCQGPGPNACTSCNAGYYLFNSSCISNCPIGTFEYQTICENCPKNCESCESNECSLCLNGFYLYNGECVKCDIGCKSCIFTHCEECFESYELIDGECKFKCGSREFYFNESCAPCHSSCYSCDGPLAYDCSDCELGLVLINGTCISNLSLCSENCKECGFGNVCVQCESGLVLVNGNCVKTCPANFSLVDGHCVECTPRCKKCDLQGCKECFTNYSAYGTYTLNNSLCSDTLSCISGYSYSKSSNSCQKSSQPSLLNYLHSLLAIFNI